VGTSFITVVLQIVGYLAFLPGVWQLGNQFCRLFLKLSGSSLSPQNPQRIGIKAGRYIGVLERSLVVIGIVMGSWEVIVAVVAIKTVGRYQELDDKEAAEYFLVGSLASILWAIAVAGLLAVYDSAWGFHGIKMLRELLAP
jgi:hypothetical protein